MFDPTTSAVVVFGILFAIAAFGYSVSSRSANRNNASTDRGRR